MADENQNNENQQEQAAIVTLPDTFDSKCLRRQWATACQQRTKVLEDSQRTRYLKKNSSELSLSYLTLNDTSVRYLEQELAGLATAADNNENANCDKPFDELTLNGCRFEDDATLERFARNILAKRIRTSVCFSKNGEWPRTELTTLLRLGVWPSTTLESVGFRGVKLIHYSIGEMLKHILCRRNNNDPEHNNRLCDVGFYGCYLSNAFVQELKVGLETRGPAMRTLVLDACRFESDGNALMTELTMALSPATSAVLALDKTDKRGGDKEDSKDEKKEDKNVAADATDAEKNASTAEEKETDGGDKEEEETKPEPTASPKSQVEALSLSYCGQSNSQPFLELLIHVLETHPNLKCLALTQSPHVRGLPPGNDGLVAYASESELQELNTRLERAFYNHVHLQCSVSPDLSALHQTAVLKRNYHLWRLSHLGSVRLTPRPLSHTMWPTLLMHVGKVPVAMASTETQPCATPVYSFLRHHVNELAGMV